MNKWARYGISGLLGACLGVQASAQEAELRAVDGAQPEVAIQHLDDGGYSLKASIRITAPVNVVWEVLRDCGQALRYVPGMRLCEVLESGPDYDVARHKVRRYRLLPAMDYVFRSDYHPHHSVDVTLLEGDLRRLEGQWRFTPCGKACTVLSYDFVVEAGWLVPRAMERKALTQDVPEMLSRLREQSTMWYQEVQAVQSQAVHEGDQPRDDQENHQENRPGDQQ